MKLKKTFSHRKLSRGDKRSRNKVTTKTKVLSGRITNTQARDLKELYPSDTKESEIINDLVQEKLARAAFDQWITGLQGSFDIKDFDIESIR